MLRPSSTSKQERNVAELLLQRQHDYYVKHANREQREEAPWNKQVEFEDDTLQAKQQQHVDEQKQVNDKSSTSEQKQETSVATTMNDKESGRDSEHQQMMNKMSLNSEDDWGLARSGWSRMENQKKNYIKRVKGVSESEAKQLMKFLWSNDFSDLSFVKDQAMLDRAYERQKAFLKDPVHFRPRPLLYRSILAGMGWGNMMYDIAHHVIFALITERPFLMMIDFKDPHGNLGWKADAMNEAIFLPRVLDWRWGKKQLLELFPHEKLSKKSSNEHYLVTCRQGYDFHETCGGDQAQGNFEPLMQKFKDDKDKILYSEYSASFIRPLRNSNTFKNFMIEKLGSKKLQMRLAFAMMFSINETFREERVFPHLRALTQDFTRQFLTVHIRTGHLEGGVVRDKTLETDDQSLMDCYRNDPVTKQTNRTWLVLTDNAELAARAHQKWGAYVTVDPTSFSLHKFHVGMTKPEFRKSAWEVSLADWLLIVESTGPTLLRSTMHSAFSYGQRGSLIAGLQCERTNKKDFLFTCGNEFFAERCERV